jgi:hypothetical protein
VREQRGNSTFNLTYATGTNTHFVEEYFERNFASSTLRSELEHTSKFVVSFAKHSLGLVEVFLTSQKAKCIGSKDEGYSESNIRLSVNNTSITKHFLLY